MSDISDTLAKHVPQILEEWAMMMIDPAELESETFDSSQPFFVAEMEFVRDGRVCGRSCALAQGGFSRALSENVLGVTESLEKTAEQIDAMKELLNIVTGHFVSDFYSENCVVELRAPECRVVSWEEAQAYLKEDSVAVMADEQPVAFSVHESK